MTTQGTAPYFPWRGWAFCSVRDKELFSDYVNEAVDRASDYGVNLLEFHDYTCPGGIVDAVITYRDFNRLQPDHTDQQRTENHAYFRELAQKAKGQGLELNCWYHVFRYAPEELASIYPEVGDVDKDFVWNFIASSLDEFFHLMPEVDRLTLTSLHETPSIMQSGGSMSREERLLTLYTTIYDACKAHGKGLVIRDFIVKHEDAGSFLRIMDALSDDVVVMTKEVFADWTHLNLPLTQYLSAYRGRNLVVEVDVYGEYAGRLDMPCCIPEYVHDAVRGILPFEPLGVTARLLHDNAKSRHFKTIFDSPNDINVYALGRFLHDPGYQLAPDQRWHGNYAQMDGAVWREWAIARYGEQAAATIVRALRRTAEIVRLTYDAARLYDQVHSQLPPTLNHPHFRGCPQPTLEDRLDSVGFEMLRDEKEEALHLAKRSLADVESVADALEPNDSRQLKDLFEGTIFIIKAFRARLEMTHARKVYRESPFEAGRQGLASAGSAAEELAGDIRARFGDGFCGGLSATLEQLAAKAGEAPEPS